MGMAIDLQARSVEKTGSGCDVKVLRDKVRHEVRRQLFHEKRRVLKEVIYGAKDDCEKQPQLLYKLPRWPFYTQFYEQRDLFQFDFSGSGASQSYSSQGDTQDLAALVLGQDCIVGEDLLLMSRLAKRGVLQGLYCSSTASVAGDLAVLSALADQPLVFDASTWKLAGSFNLGHHFKRGRLSFNMQLPFLVRQNRLRLTNELTDSVRSVMLAHPASRFSNETLSELYNDFLGKNDLSTSTRSTQSGLGDMVTSLYYEVPAKNLERFILGLKVVLPTSRATCVHRLWDAELGNGGFAQVGGFMSLLYGKNRWFNPHFHGNFSGSIEGRVCRRVPRRFVRDGNDCAISICSKLFGIAFSDGLTLKPGASIDELETCVRGFAATTRRVLMRPGFEGSIQIGNMFERFLVRRGFLDLFYNFRAKGRDHLASNCADIDFDASSWVKKTASIEHKIGGDWSYQRDNKTRFIAGMSYIFAGNNAPKKLEGHLTVNLEF